MIGDFLFFWPLRETVNETFFFRENLAEQARQLWERSSHYAGFVHFDTPIRELAYTGLFGTGAVRLRHQGLHAFFITFHRRFFACHFDFLSPPLR